jgi:AcrR family transcriptional regulator
MHLNEPDMKTQEPRLWISDGWTARVVKNEDDDGWAASSGQLASHQLPRKTRGFTRKKDKARLQLLEAALELIGLQGFEATSISQISASVDVSSRTVLRYFPTKEDVIVNWVEDGMAIFLSTLEERPADEPAHLSLLASAREMLKSYEARSEFCLTIERVIASSSAISARKQEMSAELGAQISVVLANRPNTSTAATVTHHLYPMVVFSMVRVAIQTWVAQDGKCSLLELFDNAAALIEFSATA